MSGPLFSIIVPTFNRKSLLVGVLETIQKQTFRNFEIIVVDDGSNDGTADFIRELSNSSVRLIRNARNVGPGAARNIGLLNSHGSLVAFLDTDDRWEPEYLELQADSILSTPPAVISFTGGVFIDGSGRQHEFSWRPKHSRKNLTWNLLCGSAICTPSSVVVTRAAACASRGFNEALKIGEDFEFYLRISELGEFKYVDKKLVRKIDSPDSLTRDYRSWERDAVSIVGSFVSARPELGSLRWRSMIRSLVRILAFRVLWRKDLKGTALITETLRLVVGLFKIGCGCSLMLAQQSKKLRKEKNV